MTVPDNDTYPSDATLSSSHSKVSKMIRATSSLQYRSSIKRGSDQEIMPPVLIVVLFVTDGFLDLENGSRFLLLVGWSAF